MRPFQYWEEDMRELKKTIGIFLLLYDINETDFKVESLTLPKTPIALNIAKISEKGCSKWAQLLKGKNDSKIQKENRIREAKLNDALGINLDTRDWKKIYKCSTFCTEVLTWCMLQLTLQVVLQAQCFEIHHNHT